MLSKILKNVFLFTLLLLIYFSIFLFLWIKSKFIEVDFNLLLFNLKILGMYLSDDHSESYDIQHIKFWLFQIPIILCILTFAIIKFVESKKKRVFLEIVFNRFLKLINFKYIILLLFFILLYVVISTINFQTFSFKNFSQNSDDSFEKIYNKPDIILKKKKENLIIVTLESFDLKYLLEKNILTSQDLNQLYQLDLKNFNKYHLPNLSAFPGAEYSLGSTVAILCGIPLKINKIQYKYVRNLMESIGPIQIFKNYKCAQDLLNEINYNTEYVSNTFLGFMGTDKFIFSHPFDNIFDNNKLIRKGYVSNPNGFAKSIFDGDVLDFIFQRLKIHNENKENFFIFGSTVETHPPGSYYFRGKCDSLAEDKINLKSDILKEIKNAQFLNIEKKERFIRTYSNVHSGSDMDKRNSFLCLIGEIKKFLKKVDKLEISDLNIIFLSDHRYSYSSDPESSLFNLIIKPKKSLDKNFKEENYFSLYDFFPLILDISAFKVNSKKNGFGSINGETKKMHLKKFDSIKNFLNTRVSANYEKLW